MSAQELFRLDVGERDNPRAITFTFHGHHSMPRTNRHSPPILDRINEDKHNVLMFDYSDAIFEHSIQDFTVIADMWSKRLADNTICTYQYAPASMSHAMLMSRLMKDRGMITGAFPNMEDALSFVRNTLKSD